MPTLARMNDEELFQHSVVVRQKVADGDKGARDELLTIELERTARRAAAYDARVNTADDDDERARLIIKRDRVLAQLTKLRTDGLSDETTQISL